MRCCCFDLQQQRISLLFGRNPMLGTKLHFTNADFRFGIFPLTYCLPDLLFLPLKWVGFAWVSFRKSKLNRISLLF